MDVAKTRTCLPACHQNHASAVCSAKATRFCRKVLRLDRGSIHNMTALQNKRTEGSSDEEWKADMRARYRVTPSVKNQDGDLNWRESERRHSHHVQNQPDRERARPRPRRRRRRRHLHLPPLLQLASSTNWRRRRRRRRQRRRRQRKEGALQFSGCEPRCWLKGSQPWHAKTLKSLKCPLPGAATGWP